MRNSTPVSALRSKGSRFFLVLPLVLSLLFSSCVATLPEVEWIGIHSLKGSIHPFEGGEPVRGGLALIGGYLEEAAQASSKSASPVPLLFATNSTIHGSPLALLSKGEAVVEVLESMGLDALFVDSREFAFGEARLADLASSAEFPFVAANIVKEDGSIPDYLRAYFYDRHSRTAFIGLAGPLLLERITPAFVQGLSILPPAQALEAQIRALRELWPAPSRIVVMAVGYKVSRESTNSFVDEILAIRGIDAAVFGSRDADPRPPETRTVGGKKVHIFYIADDLFDEARTIDHSRISQHWETPEQKQIPVTSEEHLPAAAISSSIFYYTASAQEMLRERLLFVPSQVTHRIDQESPLANYVLDLYRDYAQTDIAILNSGALRRGFEVGTLTIREVYEVMPFQGILQKIRIDGARLLDILERSVSYRNNPQYANGFLQVSGLSYTIEPGPDGDRLKEGSVMIGSSPLRPNGLYSMVTEDFLAYGGDGYEEIARLPKESLQVMNFALLVEGLRSGQIPRDRVDGRIRILGLEEKVLDAEAPGAGQAGVEGGPAGEGEGR